MLFFSTTYAYTQNYYVDVNNGLDDADGTTIETPFKYISQAVDKVTPGDTVYLRAGTYRETLKDIPSGSPENPITFKAYQNEEVTVSGAEEITDWSNTNGMYSASVNLNVDSSHQQLFVNGKMVFQAREPEMSNHDDPFSQNWIHMLKGKPVTLKASNGKYLIKSKDNNTLHANGNINDKGVKFYLVNLEEQDRNNMNCIKPETQVAFFSTNLTDVFQIEGGGDSLENGGSSDHELIMKDTNISEWETFVIKRADGKKNLICPNDTVAVTFMAKKYKKKDEDGMEIPHGGGFLGVDLENENILSAYKNSAGENETFYMTMEPEGLFYKKNDEKNTDLNKKDDAWKGAYAWGAFSKGDSVGWALNIAKIKSSSEGQLILDEKKRDEWWEIGWYQGNVAIIGSLSALDSENEWFCENKKTLYFKPPSGKNPEELNIEFKYRTWVIDSSASYLVFQNINFFSGQIKLLGSHNLFDNIKVTYGSHFTFREEKDEPYYNVSSPFINYDRGDNGIYLEGNNNQIKNSEVTYSAGSGMFIKGKNNTVKNCLIHDFGYMGTYTSGVFFDGKNSSLTYSTLFNSGRDLLHLGAIKKCLGCTYNYNLFHSSALLANDSGLIYSFGHDHGDSEIAYNWLEGRAGYKRTVASINPGIYMDNGSRKIRIHHNVITGMDREPGIQFNTPHEKLSATNNTIIHHEKAPKDAKNKKIGEEAYCDCNFDKNSKILPMFHFEKEGICIHNIGENNESACAKKDWEDWKDKFKHEDNNYSMSIAEAKNIFRNPLESTIKENGWEISGNPDFRPFSISEGAYEVSDPNWIPGYRRVLRDESMQASLIQSNYGEKGNFELVVREGDELCHYWRDNDEEGNPWKKSTCFGQNITSAPSLIQSNYGEQGNFEVVVREGNQLAHYWRDNDKEDKPWSKYPTYFAQNITSAPSLIQSNYGEQGNFEVVVREGNKLAHYWRDNDNEGNPWSEYPTYFAQNITSAPSLIQGNYGKQGNFEVVVREGDKLFHYWRANDEENQPWRKSELFGQNIISAPSLIQSNYGKQGNFEVVVLENDKLCHYVRSNDKEGNPWSIEPICFSKGDFTSAPSLIQSNYGEQGNFEVVVREGDELYHYARRNDNEDNPWSEPIIVRDNTILSYGEEKNDWRVYDSSPAGARISSVFDEDKGQVIQLSGAGTDNGYMLGDWSGGANIWNNRRARTIQWSMKYDEDFVVYVSIDTKKGHRYLYYTNSNYSWQWKKGEYLHHGLGDGASDGIWRTFTRNLEEDLKDLEADNSIVSVNAFFVRGSGLINDIALLEKSIYEDAEDKNTNRWRVYDKTPVGAKILNIGDNDNRVIQLQGESTDNGYILGDWSGGANAWNNTTEKIIKWSMKYDEDFVIYVSVDTQKGHKYLYYTNSNQSWKWKKGEYLHHGLGDDVSDGTWRTFTRNLEEDLKDLESDNAIVTVNAFLIRGSGLVDNIEMSN